MEIAFPNLPLSGKERISSLLGHQAPGYLPWKPVQDANLCGPCLCVCLLSQGVCTEADELRRRQCLRSLRSLWHFLAGSSTESFLAEMRTSAWGTAVRADRQEPRDYSRTQEKREGAQPFLRF